MLVPEGAGRSPLPDPPQCRLRLREGVDLLGRYEGSAYQQPTYLVRRHDGQVIHLSHLLYLVALLMDGERDLTRIAEELSAQLGRRVVAANVEYLVEKKLQPLGIIGAAGDHDQADTLTRSLPLLALRYRTRVVPPQLHRWATIGLQPLFWPPVVLLMMGGLVAVNVWLFGTDRRGLVHAVRQLPFHPNLFLLVTVLVLFSGFFHELGHATATRYGGGSPGVMGVGIYLAWPAFYTDLTDSYRLDRRGRLRSDLGGVYFNAVLVVAAGVAYMTTDFGPLAAFIVVSQTTTVYQFLPFVRLDGYYIMSDLVGVPNLFAYLGPVLRSLFRRPDPATIARLHQLKPRARVAIKVWSVVTVAFLAFNVGSIAIVAPIIIPAEWAAIHLQGHAMTSAFGAEDVARGVNDLVDILLIAVAPVGMLLIAGLLLRRALRAMRRWWPTHPKVVSALAAALAVGVLFQGQTLISRIATGPGPAAVAVHAGRARAPAPGALRSPVVPPAPPSPSPSPANTPVAASSSVAAQVYVVRPNDTLWGIAAQCLGDPEQWPAIFERNVGLPQPDGRSLVDPDQIYPGWTLQLPDGQPVAALGPAARPMMDEVGAEGASAVPPADPPATGADGASGLLPPPAAAGSGAPPGQPATGWAPPAGRPMPPAGVPIPPAGGPVPSPVEGAGGLGGHPPAGDASETASQWRPSGTARAAARTGCTRSSGVCRPFQDATGQPEAAGSPPPGRWALPPAPSGAASIDTLQPPGQTGEGETGRPAGSASSPIGAPERSPPEGDGR